MLNFRANRGGTHVGRLPEMIPGNSYLSTSPTEFNNFGLRQLTDEGDISTIQTFNGLNLFADESDSSRTVCKWDYRFPQITHGLFIASFDCAFVLRDDPEGGEAHIKLMSGSTEVADFEISQNGATGDLDITFSTTYGSKSYTSITPAAANSQLEITIVGNLSKKRITCFIGTTDCSVYITWPTDDLRGKYLDAFWDTENNTDSRDGTLKFNANYIDSVQFHVQSAATDWSNNPCISIRNGVITTDPLCVVGDDSAYYLGSLLQINSPLYKPVFFIGPPKYKNDGSVIKTDGLSIRNNDDDNAYCKPLMDYRSFLVPLLSLGAKKFLISIGSADIGQSGFLHYSIDFRYDGSGSASIEVDDTNIMITIDSVQYDFNYTDNKNMTNIRDNWLDTDVLPSNPNFYYADNHNSSSDGIYSGTPRTHWHGEYLSNVMITQGPTEITDDPRIPLYVRDLRILNQMENTLIGILETIRSYGGYPVVCTSKPRGGSTPVTAGERDDNAKSDIDDWNTFINTLDNVNLAIVYDFYTDAADTNDLFVDDLTYLNAGVNMVMSNVSDIDDEYTAAWALVGSNLLTAINALYSKDYPTTDTGWEGIRSLGGKYHDDWA